MSESTSETKAVDEKKKTAVKQAAKFTKDRLLKSDAYKSRRDLINALIDDGKEYTKAEVEMIISDYLKKEVK